MALLCRVAAWFVLVAFLSSAKQHDNAGGLIVSPTATDAKDEGPSSTTYRGGGFTVDVNEGTPDEPIDEQVHHIYNTP